MTVLSGQGTKFFLGFNPVVVAALPNGVIQFYKIGPLPTLTYSIFDKIALAGL